MAYAPNKRKFGRLHGVHAGAKAIVVFACTNPQCEVHYRGKLSGGHWLPPHHCLGCGGIEFDRFASEGEANQWASLRMQEKRGMITRLRRQVWFALMAPGVDGIPVKVASYVADFVYIRDGKQIIGDFKPDAGMDPVADLKLRWMAAMGNPVTILTQGAF